MYTVRFQLELNASEKRFLSKSFFYANRMHNQIVRYATNRLNALFHDKEYVGARKAYGEAEFSKKKGSELSASEKKKKKRTFGYHEQQTKRIRTCKRSFV